MRSPHWRLVAAVGAIAWRPCGAAQGLVALVGAAPLEISSCDRNTPHVALRAAGRDYVLIVDTGSSNTEIAAESCESCSGVSPRFCGKADGRNFSIDFGTGSAVISQTLTALSLGGLPVEQGSIGLVVNQSEAFGFNMFPGPDDPMCYNTFAGILGLAYRGQDAGPAPECGTTNGTTVPLLDQLVAEGMPNAFALETCDAGVLHCDPRRRDNATWLPSSECGRQQMGSLLLGGYSSERIVGRMLFTPITDEVHYDVQLLGVHVCGFKGCRYVEFPNRVSGKTEDDCMCSSVDCAPGTVSYCYFTVLDSGSDLVYMNTAANAEALLLSMDDVGVVRFPSHTTSSSRRSFWFNGTSVAGAQLVPQALLEIEFAPLAKGEPSTKVSMSLAATFLHKPEGLTQVGISGNLDLLRQFQRSKFPTLLGATFLRGKTVFFDRSRRQIGFATSREARCRLPARAADIDMLGADSVSTPGAGCRRGTGSGGGCNRGPWKREHLQADRRRLQSAAGVAALATAPATLLL